MQQTECFLFKNDELHISDKTSKNYAIVPLIRFHLNDNNIQCNFNQTKKLELQVHVPCTRHEVATKETTAIHHRIQWR